jgi:hypothetical protein
MANYIIFMFVPMEKNIQIIIASWKSIVKVHHKMRESNGPRHNKTMCGTLPRRILRWTPCFNSSTIWFIKGRAVTCCEGTEGRYRFSHRCTISALEGGGRPTPRPGCFTPRKDPVRIVHEAGAGLDGYRKSDAHRGSSAGTVSLWASCYADWAIPSARFSLLVLLKQ